MTNTTNLRTYAEAAFNKAVQGQFTPTYIKQSNQDKNVFLVVADGQTTKGVSFRVSLDKKGWLVETV